MHDYECTVVRDFARQLLSKILRNIFPRKHYTEPHLVETMAFSQPLSVRMFLSQSYLHEPFIRNACIFPPLLQNLIYDVFAKKGGGARRLA